jgi:hypothetical protein
MDRGILRSRALALLIAIVAVLIAAGCDLVAGDSLVVNAAASDPGANLGGNPPLAGDSTVDGVVLRGVAGIAACDYRGLMQQDFAKWKPKRVSLAFSGNSGTTPCTRDSAGRPLTGAALALRYHDDLVAVTKFFAAHGAGVIYSAPICVRPDLHIPNGDPLLRTMERNLAASFARQRFHVAYSEYAALQICPSWTYLPQYRAADGLHLSAAGATIFAAALRKENKTTPIP